MFKLTITGNLGQDSKIETINGRDYLTYSVGVYRGPDKTEWVDVYDYPGKEPQKRLDIFRKGAKVLVEGELAVSTWQGRDGQTRLSVRCWAREVEVLKFAMTAPAEKTAPERNYTPATIPAEDPNDPDLPF